jgi:FAD/FMN-containing dehydrogenase
MLSRREFLILAAQTGWMLSSCGRTSSPTSQEILVNDVHSRLNPTRVRGIVTPRTLNELSAAIRTAKRHGLSVSTAGGRHAMGGQQFARDALLIDMTSMNRVLAFDAQRGTITVEAGIQWPAVIDYLIGAQAGAQPQWAIVQKQTGADQLSIGGAVAANIHGRGLRLQPFAADIESLLLLDADGIPQRCSRAVNRELFSLAIGGYGLFGVVAEVVLRLTRRTKLERIVIETDVAALMPHFDQRVAEGFTFGDFQYAIDETSPEFLRRGILSCYRPVPIRAVIPDRQEKISASSWRELARLAHEDRAKAYRLYADYYLGTSGQIYWSDLHQLSTYVADYHSAAVGGPDAAASEMISELYVPRHRLGDFLARARQELRQAQVPLVYGTIRLIEADDVSFLAWAREAWACTIFNLHVVHSADGLERAQRAFRALIDCAIDHGGSYYLTYHRWATRDQVEACHPRLVEFLRQKKRFDPAERFTSDWYRHYTALFSDVM